MITRRRVLTENLSCFTLAAPNLVQVLSRCCSVVCWNQKACSSHSQGRSRIQKKKKKIDQKDNLCYVPSAFSLPQFDQWDSFHLWCSLTTFILTQIMKIDFVFVHVKHFFFKVILSMSFCTWHTRPNSFATQMIKTRLVFMISTALC